jgi:hypothetical protein
MEHKFYTDDFERLLKEKSDEFRMYPSKRVWYSIYNDLHPDRKWPSIAVTLVLVTVLFLIGYWNNSNNISENLAAGTTHSNKKIAADPSGKTTNLPESFLNTNNQAHSTTGIIAPASVNTANSLQNNQQETVANPQPQFTGTANTNVVVINNASNKKRKKLLITNSGSNNKGNKLNEDFTIAVITSAQPVINANNVTINTTKQNDANSNTTTDTVVIAKTQNNAEKVNIDIIAISETEGSDEVDDAAAANKVNNSLQNKTDEPAAAVKKESKAGNQLSAQDKSWMEHYAMYNKPTRKKWKGRLSSEVFLTPGVTLRSFYSNTSVKLSSVPSAVNMPGAGTAMPGYTPGLSFQTGAGISYAASKNIRVKAGVQASFTNYAIPVTDINHPVLTTLTLNNLNSGYPYLESRASLVANVPGHNNKKVHNQTSQVSIPVGMALRLGGNSKVEWYVAGGVQPTYIMGGKAYLVSSDHNNFVSEPSMLRKWNMNGSAETYIHYKMNGFTLQAGPELRYQFFSNYSGRYSYSEKLYNAGIKLGIVKNL